MSQVCTQLKTAATVTKGSFNQNGSDSSRSASLRMGYVSAGNLIPAETLVGFVSRLLQFTELTLPYLCLNQDWY